MKKRLLFRFIAAAGLFFAVHAGCALSPKSGSTSNPSPADAVAAQSYFRLGEASFKKGDLEEALSWYKKSLQKGLEPNWQSLAIYRQAVCHARLVEKQKSDWSQVFRALDRLPAHTESRIQVRAASLRISSAKKKGDSLQEAKGYLELLDGYERLDPAEKGVGDLNWIVRESVAREELQRWVEDDSDVKILSTLESWEKQFDGKTSGGVLFWKIARLYHQKGDYRNAGVWTERYLSLYPKHDYAGQARALLAEIEKRDPEASFKLSRSSIGVLLPLSGDYAVYGESVLHGLECAAGIFAPCEKNVDLNLDIHDTKGSPESAARGIQEYSQTMDIKAVIGPLSQAEIGTTVNIAEAAGLPLIALSQKSDVAKQGNFIFRNFLTVADQVASLVDFGCNEKKWKRFAVLYPADQAGEEYRRVFEEEVSACGGEVVARASYSPTTFEFVEPLRGLKFSSAKQKASEQVSFQALFVPDTYRRVPSLLEALKFLKLEKQVYLLGGVGWDHPSLAQVKGLERAYFVSGFFVRSGRYAVRDFVSTFQAAYGVEPTFLEAYAFDTLRLLGQILGDDAAASRYEIRERLARKRSFSGVTGQISFDEEGDARRKLPVLTIANGEFRELR